MSLPGYFGQSGQDKFVVSVLKNKTNGFYLEIGSNDPIHINNTYILESQYNWKGIMVEYDPQFLPRYISVRPNAHHIIQDATTVDYVQALQQINAPNAMDFLQIDLEVENRSTLTTLERLDSTVFDNYTFATVTFEHDIYQGDFFNTRQASRDIFARRGYERVFSDMSNGGNKYEDWYVHPSLVDMDYVNRVRCDESLDWRDIMNRLDTQ